MASDSVTSVSTETKPKLMDDGYCQTKLSPSVLEKLQAGAFESLCEHLRDRSESLPNMELMTASGFCRNCLAKWMVVKARHLVDNGEAPSDMVPALNALGYEQAAQYVYGMSHTLWKEQYQMKATSEQIERYQASKSLHAQHNEEVLQVRADAQAIASNVCCQEIPEPPLEPTKEARQIGPFQPPPIPTTFARPPTIAVLTISDRASSGLYKNGDLSGPAVTRAVSEVMGRPVPIIAAIVPDETAAIQAKLTTWCDSESGDAIDLILTTGGTGLGPRDLTPEATRDILDYELSTLMTFCVTESSHLQPLATLSRGTAGIRRHTVIANLPGNPAGVAELVPMLLPLLLHAVVDVQEPVTPEVLELE